MKGVKVMKICPRCGSPIYGEPAISRIDNETEICSECGTHEAIESYLDYISGEGFINEHDYEDGEVMI